MSFDITRAIFNQADTNRDGGIDQQEFNRWASSGGGSGGGSSYGSSASYGSGGYGAGAVGGGYGGSSSYESSSFESSTGYGAGAGAGYGAGASVRYGVGAAGSQGYDASSSSFSSQTAVQKYATDAQGLFQDPNPQIIRRPAAGGVQTYTQNIRVRFLQPPPVPPPGVSYFFII
jgi:hypothetical protein